MGGQLSTMRFEIADGETESNEQDCRAWQIVALQMPAAWTAANLTLKARPVLVVPKKNGNDALQQVVDDAGAIVTIAAAAGKYIVLTGDALDAMVGVASVALVASVAQAADREIIAIAAPAS